MSTTLNPVVRSLTPAPALMADDPLEQFLSGQLSERTRRAYYADLQHFFASIGLELNEVSLAVLQSITFEHIVAFRNQLASEGYKRSSINRKLSSLKSLFKMLVALGHIENNPADSTLVRGYKVDETLAGKALSNQVLNKIQQAIAEEKTIWFARAIRPYFICSRSAGCAALKWLASLGRIYPWKASSTSCTYLRLNQAWRRRSNCKHRPTSFRTIQTTTADSGFADYRQGFHQSVSQPISRPAVDRPIGESRRQEVRPTRWPSPECHSTHVPPHVLHPSD